MSTMTYGQKMFKPVAPEKGSFPLDHEGECKRAMLVYMGCLVKSDDQNSKCRDEAKDYLDCRMQRGLMAKEEWSKLGFHEQSDAAPKTD